MLSSKKKDILELTRLQNVVVELLPLRFHVYDPH